MTAIRRTLLTTALAGTALALVAGPASAAGSPRIAGSDTISFTYTASNTSRFPVGTGGKRLWKFTPTCAKGGCVTTFDRVSGTGVHYVYRITPSGVTYTGSTTYGDNCYNIKTGALILKNAYNDKETLTLKVTKVVGGSAKAFTAKIVFVYTPTAAARAKGCQQENFTASARWPAA